MEKQDLSLGIFKKVEKRQGFPSWVQTPITIITLSLKTYNDLNHKGGLSWVQTPLKNKRKRLGFFGKQ